MRRSPATSDGTIIWGTIVSACSRYGLDLCGARCGVTLLLLLLWWVTPLTAQMEPCTPAISAPAPHASRDVDYILVVDSTGSMSFPGGKDLQGNDCQRWVELRERLLQTVQGLEPGENIRVHLLLFGGSVYPGGKPLPWRTLPAGQVRLPGDRTSAVTVDLRSDVEKQQILRLLADHRPSAGGTALWDAVAAAFDRAVAIHDEASHRRILVAVFSDGDDRKSPIFTVGPRGTGGTLCDHVAQARARLGSSLVNEQFYFIRVAGVVVTPPCGVSAVDRTPSMVQVNLGPNELQLGSLGPKQPPVTGNLTFSVSGPLPAGAAFPIVFDPDPPGPQVRVVCTEGAPAAVAAPGTYSLRFLRVDPAANYERPFSGRLRLDLGPYRDGAVDGVQIWSLRQAVAVSFAGVPALPVEDLAVQPTNGLRVLTGAAVSFRAPALQGAAYEWTLDLPTGQRTNLTTPEGVLRFATEGRAQARLTIRRAGFTDAVFARTVNVVDPRLAFEIEPARPVEGEPVSVTLRHNPALPPQRVRWDGVPQEARLLDARYSFDREGTYTLSAGVQTELGTAAVSRSLAVDAGVPAPVILAPQTALFLSTEAQNFSAEAGRGVASVRFTLQQAGRNFDLGTVPVHRQDDRWLATTNRVLPADLNPGPALVVAESLARDPVQGTRLGRRSSTNQVELTRLPLLGRLRSPTERIVHWNHPLVFEAEFLGPGAARLNGVQWDVSATTGSEVQGLPGLGRVDRDLIGDPDARLSSFSLRLDYSDVALRELAGRGGIRVRATPLGDARVVEGQSVVWDDLRVQWAPARFVLYAPRRCVLDRHQPVRVIDVLGGHPVERVRWTFRGAGAQTLFETAGAVTDLVATNIGAHELVADVVWQGGQARTEPAPVWVDFEPVHGVATWDGGRDPELVGRGIRDRNVSLAVQELGGSRSAVVVEVSEPGRGNTWTPVPSWPKTFRVDGSTLTTQIPWPPYPRNGPTEYRVAMRLHGFTEDGRQVQVEGASFRILNQPPVPWWIWLLLLLALILVGLSFKWCWGNDLRYSRLFVGTRREEIRTHASMGFTRLDKLWGRWAKQASLPLGSLPLRVDGLPAWLKDGSISALTVTLKKEQGKPVITLSSVPRNLSYDFDNGLGTLTWRGPAAPGVPGQIFLSPEPPRPRFRWEPLLPWLLVVLLLVGFILVRQHLI